MKGVHQLGSFAFSVQLPAQTAASGAALPCSWQQPGSPSSARQPRSRIVIADAKIPVLALKAANSLGATPYWTYNTGNRLRRVSPQGLEHTGWGAKRLLFSSRPATAMMPHEPQTNRYRGVASGQVTTCRLAMVLELLHAVKAAEHRNYKCLSPQLCRRGRSSSRARARCPRAA